MNRFHFIPAAPGLLLLCLVGCGGGLGLTGGSVPIGGRAVSGTAVLPNTAAIADAAVIVRSLPAGTVLRNATTDSAGSFTASNVPTDVDVEIDVMSSSTVTLRLVVPQATLAANPGQPLNVGQVTALSTIVAEAISLAVAQPDSDPGTIIATQTPYLTMHEQQNPPGANRQNQDLNNPGILASDAQSAISASANNELQGLASAPGSSTVATAALHGLLCYLGVSHGAPAPLTAAQRTALINAQIAGRSFTADQVAAALNAAGDPTVTAAMVQAASQAERAMLPALSGLGSRFTPFEAVLIGGDTSQNGGLQLNPQILSTFLANLIGT